MVYIWQFQPNEFNVYSLTNGEYTLIDANISFTDIVQKYPSYKFMAQ